MHPVGHRPATQTRCRFAADAAVALTAVTRNRTIASCCDAVARQTLAKPARSRLRPPNTKRPNTHSDRGTATAPPPAGSFPAGFRTPAQYPWHRPRGPASGTLNTERRPSTRGIVREGRHPEPSTLAEVSALYGDVRFTAKRTS